MNESREEGRRSVELAKTCSAPLRARQVLIWVASAGHRAAIGPGHLRVAYSHKSQAGLLVTYFSWPTLPNPPLT